MSPCLLKQLVPLAERRAQEMTIAFNFEGLLPDDTASWDEAYEKAICMGIATRSECAQRGGQHISIARAFTSRDHGTVSSMKWMAVSSFETSWAATGAWQHSDAS